MLQESTNVLRTGHAKCVALNRPALCTQYHSRTRPSAAMLTHREQRHGEAPF